MRVPRLLDIWLLLPLNLPDSFTDGSSPKKATRCFGLVKFLISPISLIIVIAVNSPTPGVDFNKLILSTILAGISPLESKLWISDIISCIWVSKFSIILTLDINIL